MSDLGIPPKMSKHDIIEQFEFWLDYVNREKKSVQLTIEVNTRDGGIANCYVTCKEAVKKIQKSEFFSLQTKKRVIIANLT